MEAPRSPLEERLAASLPRLRAHLRQRTPEADDVAQEVLARALRYSASFDESRPVWPWLRRVVDHVLTDRGRAEFLRPMPVADLDPPDPEADSADDRDEIAALLAQLRPIEREVLLRFHQGGETVSEIAAALDLPMGTVKSHLSRARRRLADLPHDPERP